MESKPTVCINSQRIDEWIDLCGKDAAAAVPLLQAVQDHYGFLPREVMDLIVEKTHVKANQLYGVATFYSQFRLTPAGRYTIKVCHGTACHVRGSDRINTALEGVLNLEEGSDTSADGAYSIENVACVGCCSLAPVMVLDDKVMGDVNGTKAIRALRKHAQAHNEKISE